MKTRIFILSSLVCLCGTFSVFASDCTGAGCDTEPMVYDGFEWNTNKQNPTTIIVATPMTQSTPVAERNVDAKVLSIKPVPEDTRPALWDGVHGKYTGTKSTKTVDWKNGVPIWDESINNYKYKDFSDWFLEPSPELYIRETDTQIVETVDPIDLFRQNMEDAQTTRNRVEELLAPKKPSGSLWFSNIPAPRTEYVAQDMTEIVNKTFGTAIPVAENIPVAETVSVVETKIVEESVTGDDCPFDSATECEIWRRKPIVRETLSPRSPKLRETKVADFVRATARNIDITANESVSAPLLDRYKMLMRSAQACCTDGMAYSLKEAGASDGLVYKFLSDDANFYGFGTRCLMMTDHELDTKYPNTATAVVAADVRNGCLCRGRQWFQAMLAPFEQVYQSNPAFRTAQFSYTYIDGLQREITVSVNNDVQNVLKQLSQCP